MSGVSVLQHFEAYQKARVTFVQAVAEAATRPQNIEVMQNAGVMQLLRPLLLDNVREIEAVHSVALNQSVNSVRLPLTKSISCVVSRSWCFTGLVLYGEGVPAKGRCRKMQLLDYT